MGDLSANFSRSEFTCKCGCGLDAISSTLIKKLQLARDNYGRVMHITSGCRCRKHNKAEGSFSTSSHLPGKDGMCLAADIAYGAGGDLYSLIKALQFAGFTRIGINFAKHFVHCDVDSTKPQPTIFSY